mmetsp:Transcript_63384/g.182455  ORF Transcript_63384/g.182455 Transcript_63384/m.182455 type:complete len:282 (-) Transcript_63384:113-958(-)
MLLRRERRCSTPPAVGGSGSWPECRAGDQHGVAGVVLRYLFSVARRPSQGAAVAAASAAMLGGAQCSASPPESLLKALQAAPSFATVEAVDSTRPAEVTFNEDGNGGIMPRPALSPPLGPRSILKGAGGCSFSSGDGVASPRGRQPHVRFSKTISVAEVSVPLSSPSTASSCSPSSEASVDEAMDNALGSGPVFEVELNEEMEAELGKYAEPAFSPFADENPEFECEADLDLALDSDDEAWGAVSRRRPRSRAMRSEELEDLVARHSRRGIDSDEEAWGDE